MSLRSLLLLSTLSSCMFVYANAVPTTAPACTAKQIRIYEVAVDMPGMMKSQSLYGIINHSKTACSLQGVPTVVGLSKGSPVTIAAAAQQNSNVVILPPMHHQKSIPSNQLAWFAFQGNAASNGPTFTQIQVTLPGIPDHPYTISYSGYSTAVSGVTAIQQDAQNWIQITA